MEVERLSFGLLLTSLSHHETFRSLFQKLGSGFYSLVIELELIFHMHMIVFLGIPEELELLILEVSEPPR